MLPGTDAGPPRDATARCAAAPVTGGADGCDTRDPSARAVLGRSGGAVAARSGARDRPLLPSPTLAERATCAEPDWRERGERSLRARCRWWWRWGQGQGDGTNHLTSKDGSIRPPAEACFATCSRLAVLPTLIIGLRAYGDFSRSQFLLGCIRLVGEIRELGCTKLLPWTPLVICHLFPLHIQR